MNNSPEFRDYSADLLEVVNGCTTAAEVRKALWDAGLHVGRRPPDTLGRSWRAGLFEAIETSEDEESGWVVVCRHALSMALLGWVELTEQRDHYRGWIKATLADDHLWREQGEEHLRDNVRTTLAGAFRTAPEVRP